MPKNMVEPERPQTTWRLHVVCWISEATREQAHARARAPTATDTDTHTRASAREESEYVTIIAFSQQERFHERASVRHT